MIGYFKVSVLLTYMNVVSAVIGMYFALNGQFHFAMACLILAGVCDMFDGKVARRRERTEHEKGYGIELDAIADIVSFGVFPAIIGYGLGLCQFYHMFLHALFILAALTRLAYFNVTEIEHQAAGNVAPRKYYEGLPVTSVAIYLPFFYVLMRLLKLDAYLPVAYGILLAITAVAFVSRVKVPKIRGKALIFFALISIPMVVCLFVIG
ncbi:CDP-alcohol phosphatidyltransferase family protein [Christensenellaceae bacterium OttesenSCG-928-M15]|nr:CDP-alcohol phosphatidyltransferase family protein [Christensenellaceae bacterium OttesenSCG-928-M15]